MMPQGTSFGGGFDFMFTLVPILIGIVFVIVIVGFISNGARYVKNAKSPRTSEFARVVSKRMDVRHHTNHHNGDNSMIHSSNSSRTYTTSPSNLIMETGRNSSMSKICMALLWRETPAMPPFRAIGSSLLSGMCSRSRN